MNENDKQSKRDDEVDFCGLPVVPDRPLDTNIDPNRESLVRYIEKKWVNYTVLHYFFLDSPGEWQGDEAQKQVVRESFAEWKNLGIGLEFREVSDSVDAEIRIGFEPGGSWSYVGRDAIDLVSNINDRTMNFGWDLTTPYGHDTALHEIGHALGFPHEHQNPIAGIVWNEEAVYSRFGGPPNNWSRSKTYHNVIRKISPEAVHGSKWDNNSIMHYRFGSGLIVTPEKYHNQPLIPAPGLSNMDIDEVKKFYPEETGNGMPELIAYLSRLVQVEPGEQLDYVIKPSESRDYNIQTFGNVDTVMVLFEDVNGEPVYLSGDDDSGTKLNAHIKVRLLRNRTYYLRLRLYSVHATGQGAVMLW